MTIGVASVGVSYVASAGSASAAVIVADGPVYPPPGGVTFASTGSLGNAGGADRTYSAFNPAAFSQLAFGMTGDTSPAYLSMEGSVQTSDYLHFDSTNSNLPGGIIAYSGATYVYSAFSTGPVTVNTALRITLTNYAGAAVPVIAQGALPAAGFNATLPVSVGTIGGVAPVPSDGAGNLLLHANIQLLANGQASNVYFNNVNHTGLSDRVRSSVSTGFYSTRAVPTLTTAATSTAAVGSAISDGATLAGGFALTGTVSYSLFAAGDTTCTGTPVFTVSKTVSGAGTYTSSAFTPTTTGTYRWIASYSGDANNVAVMGACNDSGETSTVNQATPTIATSASASVSVGGTISDSATLASGASPSGTITFTSFGPNNPSCTGTPAFTATTPVTGNGTYPSSLFTPTSAGTYRWIASYSGDANNASMTAPCNAANESVVVSQVTPTISTTASTTVAAGGSVNDSATLSGGLAPTGTITFTAFGPNDAKCANAAVFTSSVPVNSGNGTYASGAFPAPDAGTYNFVASYGGDANNASASGACGAAGESVVVTQALPTLVTQSSATVTLGSGTISDTATLAGGSHPTGTITYKLFGPSNDTCAGSPTATYTTTVTGNGDYPSTAFTPIAAGTYHFVATYGGDVNNAVAGPSGCSDAAETTVVTKAALSLSTAVSSALIVAGGSFTDNATLTGQPVGAATPTGTVTFAVYGPAIDCSGSPWQSSSNALNASGTGASSTAFAPTTPGTYRVIAIYSGDSNYAASGPTGCNDTNETLVVAKASPTIATTPSSTVAAGGTVSDSATLTGGSSPSGSISFALYGPGTDCSTTAVSTTSGTIATGTAASGPVTVTAAGVYRWIATYAGDTSNNGVTSLCGENTTVTAGPLDHLVLSPATSSILTGASQAYTAEGRDQYNNTLGDVTASTVFTITSPGTCSSASCTGPAGTYPVTGTKGGKTGSATLTIGKAATTTTLVASTTSPGLNAPVTFTATVHPVAPATAVPTGNVSFYLDGSTTAAATVPLDLSGSAQFIATFGGGTHTVVAVYNGSTSYTGSSSSPATTVSVTVVCTRTVTGTQSSLTVSSGTTCLRDATISGGISVAKGASIDIENSTINGSLSISSPASVRICGSTTGSIAVTTATGFVRIGDPMNNCAANTINGGVTAVNNKGGGAIVDNTVSGTVTVSNNVPAFTVSGNHH